MLRESNLALSSASQFDPTSTFAGGTFSWLLQASRCWSGGPRPISQSVERQCSPSQRCLVTMQTWSLLTISSAHLHLPHRQISLYSLTSTRGIAQWLQSPSYPEPCLLSYTPSASAPASSSSTAYAEGGHGGLHTGPGPDQHKKAGTVDQRCLLAICHLVMCCHFSHSIEPRSYHPSTASSTSATSSTLS